MVTPITRTAAATDAIASQDIHGYTVYCMDQGRAHVFNGLQWVGTFDDIVYAIDMLTRSHYKLWRH